MTKKIRVLVVDDSAFMRKMLTKVIESDPQCKVIKTAKDGLEALKAIEKLRPDVVTLDIELPEIDGLTCLGYIMEKFPTPVVMVTGFSEFLGEETIKALEYGAVGFVRKPKGSVFRNMKEIKQDLISQIKLALRVDVTKLTPVTIEEAKEKVQKPAAVLVVQHMPADFIPSFAKRLNWESELVVKVAEDAEPIQQGKVLIAPADFHCRIKSKANNSEAIKLDTPSKEENFHFGLADKPMTSLAPIYGKNAIGVVLTGMGNDGTEGLRAIKKYGGYTIAEDESTAIVNGMPKSAIQAGVVDKVVPLSQIADEIVKKSKDKIRISNEGIRV